jgi:hypothetical protein
MTIDQTNGSARRITASKARLSRKKQVLMVLAKIAESGGVAQMKKIYGAVEEQMGGSKLSEQGKASLRELVNRYAVRMEYVFPHDPKNPGWRITPKGRDLVERDKPHIKDTSIERVREATFPHGSMSIVHVEEKDLTDEEFDRAVSDKRLRIGIVETKTETSISRQRRGQDRIRKLTLSNYSSRCALCDVNEPPLLVASHIVGWAELPEARGILSNIMCLCRFHDVLFENGYLSLADDLTLLKKASITSRTIMLLLDNTIQFRKPHSYPPDRRFLQWHRHRSGLKSH